MGPVVSKHSVLVISKFGLWALTRDGANKERYIHIQIAHRVRPMKGIITSNQQCSYLNFLLGRRNFLLTFYVAIKIRG